MTSLGRVALRCTRSSYWHFDSTQQTAEVTTPITQVAPNTAVSEIPMDATSSFSLKSYDDLYNSYDLSHVENDPILNRPQKLASFTWPAASVYSTTLHSDAWFPTLFHLLTSAVPVNNPLARILSGYMYFKADIELTVWTSGNQNCTGALAIATRWDRNSTPLSMSNMCGDPNYTILSCQSQEKQRILIPYKSAVWNPRDPAQMKYYWGTTYFTVLSAMRNATSVTPPSLEVYVQGRFVNIRLLGPSAKAYQSSVSPAPKGKPDSAYRLIYGTPTSALWYGTPPQGVLKAYTRSFSKKTRQNLVTLSSGRLYLLYCSNDTVLSMDIMTKALRDISSPANYLFNQMDSLHRAAMRPNKPRPPNKIPQSSFKKEAQLVAKTGLNFVKDQIPGSRVALSMAKTVGRLFAPKFVDALEDWGFDYVLNQGEIQRIRQENLIPLSWKSGVNPSLSTGPTTYDPTEQIDDPMGKDYSQFSNYLTLKSYIRSMYVTTSTTVDTQVLFLPVCPAYGLSSASGVGHILLNHPLSWLANKFKYWRGSLKYRFMFFCPTGVTASFRLTHQPEASAAAASFVASQDAGDLISEIIYVTRDMIHEVSIPFSGFTPTKLIPFNPCLLANYTDITTSGTLTLGLVTKVVNSFAIDSGIDVAVFVESDPDDPIRFYGLKDDNQKIYQSELTPTAGVAPPDVELHANTIINVKGKNAVGFTTQQEFKSFKELALSYQQVTLTDGTLDPLLKITEFIQKSFTAYRGNSRWIIRAQVPANFRLTSLTCNTDDPPIAFGRSFPILACQDTNFIYLEAPYASNVPWREFRIEYDYTRVFQDLLDVVSVNPVGYFAMSDDLQLFFPSFPANLYMADSAG